MAEPKVRFKRDDGSSYPTWKEYSISDLFTKIGNKNKDGQNTNVITNSAEFGLIPQRDYFDKDIAIGGNTGNYTIIQTGDFVYNPRKSSYAPMGPFNCYRLEEDGIVSPLYSCLRPKGILSPEYLLWYFQTDKWYGYVNDHGAQNGARHDRVGMTDKILMGIPVTAPCEEEQQKIANFLSSVDVVISTSEQEVANLETQKNAVMRKIFSQVVRFKRADGSGFAEWEEMTIGDMGEMHGGLSGKSKDDFGHGNGSFITYMNVYKNPFASSDLLEKVDIKPNEKQYKIHYGDVMFTQSSETVDEVGLSSVWMYHTEPYMNSFCMVLRPYDLTRLIPEFVGYLFRSDAVRKQIMLQGQGITRVNLAPSRLVNVCFKYPTEVEEQHLIASFLSDFDDAILAAKKELALWKVLKKGLLQQMFV